MGCVCFQAPFGLNRNVLLNHHLGDGPSVDEAQQPLLSVQGGVEANPGVVRSNTHL